MLEDLRNTVHQLSESEAKTMLLQTLVMLNMIKESHGPPEQLLEELSSWYREISALLQQNKIVEREDTPVHIVCGEAAAGSLRIGFGYEQKVIGFPDFFAVGPIEELHSEAGRQRRYEWVKEQLKDDHFEDEYEQRFSKALSEIDSIPDHLPIVIWTAENASEQTGIRYLLHLLKEKANDIYLINSTLAYQEIFNTNNYKYFYFHTGEITPEKLPLFYQTKSGNPLTSQERRQFEEEWLTLSNTKEVVRIWKNNEITAANEDYFDEFLIKTARKLHKKQKEKDFIKSARLIGEVYGQNGHIAGDAFLEYRLRTLIHKGIFEIKGLPKSMRFYSVKLNS